MEICVATKMRHLLILLVLLQMFIATCIGTTTLQVSNGSHLEQLLCSQDPHSLDDTTLLLRSDTLYEIQPGNFCLVSNVTNLTIRGSDTQTMTRIECVRNSSLQISGRGFGFLSARNLTLENLVLENCGGVISSEVLCQANLSEAFYFKPNDEAVLLMNNCVDCQFRKITITGHYGFGFVGTNIAESIVLDQVIVENNHVYNCLYSNETCDLASEVNAYNDHSEGGGILFLITQTNHTSQLTNLNITNSLVSNNLPFSNPNITYNCTQKFLSKNSLLSAEKTTRSELPSLTAGALTLIFEKSADDTIVDVHISNTTFYNSYGLCFGAILVVYQDDPKHGAVNIVNCTFLDNSLFSGLGGSSLTAYIHHQGKSLCRAVLSITETNFYTNVHLLFNVTNPYIFVEQFSSSSSESMICLKGLFSNTSREFLYAKQNGINDLKIYMEDIVIVRKSIFVPGLDAPDWQIKLDNSLDSGIFTFYDVAKVVLNGSNHESCNFTNLIGSAIFASSTELFLTGNISFHYNTATEISGAAVSLRSNSHLWLKEPLSAIFSENYAFYGGAIYSLSQVSEKRSCVFQYDTQQVYSLENISSININMTFSYNDALFDGRSIYANHLYNCSLLNTPFSMIAHKQVPNIFNTIFHFSNHYGNLYNYRGISEISSPPTNLCICNDSSSEIVACGSRGTNQVVANITTYPGATFPLFMVPVDDYQIQVYSASPIVSSLSLQQTILEQSVAPIGPNCTKVNNKVIVRNQFYDSLFGVLVANPISSFQSQGSFELRIRIQINDCPIGFELSQEGECICIKLFSDNNIHCDIDTQRIIPPNNTETWIGGSPYSAVGFSHYCTNRYCDHSPMVYIDGYDLSNPGATCRGNRRGVLCGKCINGFSVVVGDPDCKECSKFHLFTLFFYIAAGIFLVLLLFILRITVNTGLIHGLIFYVNLFQINTYYFLNPSSAQAFVIFISFLNLNLGFPLCLYNGMTTIVKQYLEFVFVLYIWVIAITLIFCSKRSSKISKVVSRSAVPVLATLFQLCFSKMLYIVVSALVFTTIYQQDYNSNKIYSRTVWYYDGEVWYLQDPEHIGLFILVLLTLIFFLIPYTIILTGVKCFTRYRIINRFKPLIDAYTSPYKDKYRFWYGLRLWVLIIVYTAFAVLRELPQAVILLQTLILILLLCVQASVMPFKNHLINILDLFFVVNAIAMSVFGLYFSDPSKLAITSGIMVAMAFIVFCCIVFHHLWVVLGCRYEFFRNKLRNFIKRKKDKEGERDIALDVNTADGFYDGSRLRASYIEDYAETCK